MQNVSKIFQHTKNTGCELTCIFVHQWTDGEGNWDIFGLHPLRGLFHWNRFWGIRHPAIEEVNLVRKEIYSLFNNRRNFPLISRKKWMILLEESEAKVTEVIVALADSFKCIPKMKANYVLWLNKTGKTVAIFFVYKGYPKLNDYYNIYKTIKDNDCPITYLFQRAHPQVFDIFRFSELSYLEHCNQFK